MVSKQLLTLLALGVWLEQGAGFTLLDARKSQDAGDESSQPPEVANAALPISGVLGVVKWIDDIRQHHEHAGHPHTSQDAQTNGKATADAHLQNGLPESKARSDQTTALPDSSEAHELVRGQDIGSVVKWIESVRNHSHAHAGTFPELRVPASNSLVVPDGDEFDENEDAASEPVEERPEGFGQGDAPSLYEHVEAAGDEGTRTPSDSQDFVPDEESGDLDEGEDKVGNDGGYLGAGPDEPRTIAAPGLFSGDLSSAISAVFNGQSPGPSSPPVSPDLRESNNHAEQEKPAGQSQAGEPRNETSNSSLVLVGNGRSVTAKKMGSIIDSYGIVGRFNYFELGEFAQFVGTRTDLWFLGEMKVPGKQGVRGKHTKYTSSRRMNLKIRPTMRYIVPVIYQYGKQCKPKLPGTCKIPSPESGRVKKLASQIISDYKRHGLAEKLEVMSPKVQAVLAHKYGYSEQYPSSGLMAIVYCLERFGAPVTIHGFDFMGKSLGHYYEKVKKTWTVHSMGSEGHLIQKLISRGVVKRL